MKPTLIYCYDALCGWCFGFSPVMNRIKSDFQNDFNFEILSGGMMLGNRVGPVGKIAPFIKTAYKTVEQHTGTTFGKPYLDDLLGPGAMVLNSWKPSLALTAFKSMNQGDAFLFGSALQSAIYNEGKWPDSDQTFLETAVSFGLNGPDFVAFMHSDSIQEQTKNEFKRVGAYGVQGFPALLFDFGGDFAQFTSGYRSYEDLKTALTKVLAVI